MEIPVSSFILSLEMPGLTQGRHFLENWVRTLKRRYGLHIFVRVNDVYQFFFLILGAISVYGPKTE